MTQIIIAVPPYTTQSNGVRSLHKLCHTINLVGGNARLVFMNRGSFVYDKLIMSSNPTWVNPEWNTPTLGPEDVNVCVDSIVLYPEIIQGNPLCSSKIVRWLGNKEGYLTGTKMNAKPRDFILTHSKAIRPDAHYALFNAELNPVFNDGGIPENRNINVTYTGKGTTYGDCKIQPNSLGMTRTWPYGQDQLAYLLKRTNIFYTWDSWTATNIEAILCGAVPYFLRYEPWTEEEVDGSELGPIPRIDARNPRIDAEAFAEGRKQLLENIERLNSTWDARVKEFVNQVQSWFGEAA